MPTVVTLWPLILAEKSFADKYVIRFTVTSQRTTNDDITRDWNEIRNTATEILAELAEETQRVQVTKRTRVPLKGKKLCVLSQC